MRHLAFFLVDWCVSQSNYVLLTWITLAANRICYLMKWEREKMYNYKLCNSTRRYFLSSHSIWLFTTHSKKINSVWWWCKFYYQRRYLLSVVGWARDVALRSILITFLLYLAISTLIRKCNEWNESRRFAVATGKILTDKCNFLPMPNLTVVHAAPTWRQWQN